MHGKEINAQARRGRRELFETCFTPAESHAWVEKLLNEESEPIPTTEILMTVRLLPVEEPGFASF